MMNDRNSTVASSGQGRLIAAAMNQVRAIRPFSGQPAAAMARATGDGAASDSIPGYQILEEIHRGGQGVVYKALQRSTQRHVAIKVLRDGAFSTPAEIARFEQEVRVLGRLRHPNIVRIYDSGSVGGRFHFVMDFVPGMALDAHVEKVWLRGSRDLGTGNRNQGTGIRELQTAQRVSVGGSSAAESGRESSPGTGLESRGRAATPQSNTQNPKSKIETVVRLFEKICDAVHAAHVRGIIHRDLKPGNIRVDEDGEPFVLDFGLSKLTEDKSADMTLAGQFVGSLPWAAPEQAEGRVDAIDLRTDVYSLGVLFYRTLTGAFPYRVDGGLTDVLSQIAHADPAPPRTYVPSLPADLETIVLKCLQKDPDRRYQSAGELARDLGRFIRGEAIEARRDSMTYVLGKQLARYRVAAITAAAFAAVLVAALVATIAFWRDADAARAEAIEKGRIAAEKEVEALRNAERAAEQSTLAERRAAETQRVAEFKGQMFTDIKLDAMGRGLEKFIRAQVQANLERDTIGPAPEQRKRTPEEVEASLAAFDQGLSAANGIDVARQLMDEYVLKPSAASLETQFADQPMVRAQIEEAIADAYRVLAIYDAAESHFRAALDTLRQKTTGQEAAIAAILNKLAMTLRDRGDLAQSRSFFRKSLDIYRRLPEDAQSSLPAALCNFATLLQKMGDHDGAEAHYREALDLLRQRRGEDDPDLATAQFGLATVLRQRGDRAAAEPLLREALAKYFVSLGPMHRSIATVQAELGSLLFENGDYSHADQFLTEALTMHRALLGERHPDVATTSEHLATLRKAMGDFASAERLFREALAINREFLGEENIVVATNLNNLAQFLTQKGDLDAAESLHREALALLRRILGNDHQNTGVALHNLAGLLNAKRDYDAAELLQREAIAIFRKHLGDRSEAVATGTHNLAILLTAKGEFASAEPLGREALALRRELLGPRHPLVAQSLCSLARTLHLAGSLPEAESLYAESMSAYVAALGPDHVDTASCQLRFARLLHDQGQFAKGEPLLRTALDTFLARLPADHIEIVMSRAALAYTMTASSQDSELSMEIRVARLLEAKTLLSAAWDAINRSGSVLGGERGRALLGFVDIYDALHAAELGRGYDAKAAEWRAKLVEWQATTQPHSDVEGDPAATQSAEGSSSAP